MSLLVSLLAQAAPSRHAALELLGRDLSTLMVAVDWNTNPPLDLLKAVFKDAPGRVCVFDQELEWLEPGRDWSTVIAPKGVRLRAHTRVRMLQDMILQHAPDTCHLALLSDGFLPWPDPCRLPMTLLSLETGFHTPPHIPVVDMALHFKDLL